VSTVKASSGIFQRLDRLNEFEREPVTEGQLQRGGRFAGVFAGEYVASTDFVIGVLFVSWGVFAYDVLLGLLVGNLLAVLCWVLVCAPIAVKTRLTLYWYLRQIAGPVVTVVYNVLNAILYCILAGCMITISASAVRIAFDVPPQTGWLPTDPGFVWVVIAVGAVVVTLAILGFKRLAQFASVCSPWMLLMFVAGALVMLPRLQGLGQINNFADFWKTANWHIWQGPAAGQTDAIGFWHVVAFAWICNLAMHLGLSDMALLRYAKRSAYGWYSAMGMYLGHYLAWVCAGIIGAGVAVALSTPLEDLDAGQVAVEALGVIGALAVVIAGWTTANPTLYRAGLALQVVTPGWPRWLVTLLAGIAATAIACFPFVFRHLFEFVAIYGIMLAPVGAIVVAEHWIFPRIGLTRYWSPRKGQLLNWPALASLGAALVLAAACLVCKFCGDCEIIHEFFLVIPVWILTTVLYIVLAARAGARESLPELKQDATRPAQPPAAAAPDLKPAHPAPSNPRLYYYAGGLALACLALCLVSSFCVFRSYMLIGQFKFHLIFITIAYFVSAVVWMNQREKRERQAAE